MEEIPWHLKQTGSFKDLYDFLRDRAYVYSRLSLNANISLIQQLSFLSMMKKYIFFLVPWSFCQAAWNDTHRWQLILYIIGHY